MYQCSNDEHPLCHTICCILLCFSYLFISEILYIFLVLQRKNNGVGGSVTSWCQCPIWMLAEVPESPLKKQLPENMSAQKAEKCQTPGPLHHLRHGRNAGLLTLHWSNCGCFVHFGGEPMDVGTLSFSFSLSPFLRKQLLLC